MLITTAEPILIKASARLNEATVVATTNRLSYFNQAVDQVISYSKWPWAKKKGVITLTLNQTEVDLDSEFSDYNPSWGLDDAESDEDNAIKTSLSKDNETLNILQNVAAGDQLTLWYYQSHIDVSDKTTVLNIGIPKDVARAVVLYIKHLVHDGKRQRNDARNAILDYQEVMEELVMQGASKKSASKPKRIPHPMANFKRTYATH